MVPDSRSRGKTNARIVTGISAARARLGRYWLK